VQPVTVRPKTQNPVLYGCFPADLLRKIPKVYKSYNFVD